MESDLKGNEVMKKLMLLGSLSVVLSTFAGVKETDWAKIETPDSWTPDTPLEVKITLKGTGPAGQQICSHLQWMKKAGWGGFLSWGPGKAAESGKTYTLVQEFKCINRLPHVRYRVARAGEPLTLRSAEGKEWVPVPGPDRRLAGTVDIVAPAGVSSVEGRTDAAPQEAGLGIVIR